MVDFINDSDLLEFVSKKGHGIKGLVDSGIKEVPKIYIQPLHERSDEHNNPLAKSDLSVPIDLSKLDGPEHDEVVRAIARASETLGFFQVINHGLDLELLEAVKEAAYRFFGLPAEAKAKYLKENSPSPLVKFTTSFAPDVEEVLEWRDFVSARYINDDEAEKHWPESCRKEMLQYLKLANKMITKLFELLIGNLGVKLDESRMKELIGTRVVNMNFYPPCPDPGLTIGTGSHSDSGILTALLQDEIGGLYVKIEEDVKSGQKPEWIEIPPSRGALVVNIGDLFQVLSNGRYKSVEHRVVTTRDRSRVSIPHFVSPSPTAKVAPLPELVERDGGTPYGEFVALDYMKNFFGRAHDGKKALDFAKIGCPN